VDKQVSPSIRSFLPITLTVGLLGWAGLIAVIALTSPEGGTRWALFFFSVIALTATALPMMAYMNIRFPSNPPVTSWVVVRQSIWFGVYVPTLVWLQIGRVLTLPMALLLAAGFILIEVLLRLRERSLWKS
jgi:hypothetical protein